jgi:DNA-binding XRE family transcriptional regulator
MSQAHLAGLLNVSSNYIYMIEAGRRLPSVEFCLRFASLFSINPPWIKSLWIKDYVIYVENKIKNKIDQGFPQISKEEAQQ